MPLPFLSVVAEEADARLLPQAAGLDHRVENRRIDDPVGKRLVHHLAGVVAVSSPTTSYSVSGPIGMPKLLAACSIGLDLDAFEQQLERLVHVRQQQPIDQEAGPVVHHDRRLADALGKGHGRGHGLVAGLRRRGSLRPAASAAPG